MIAHIALFKLMLFCSTLDSAEPYGGFECVMEGIAQDAWTQYPTHEKGRRYLLAIMGQYNDNECSFSIAA